MEQQKQTQDEIDLSALFRKIGDAIKAAWVAFVRFLALLRRIPLENKASFIGIIGVSVALAIAYSFLLKKKYYESTMILSSSYLNKRLVDNAIEKLDLLSHETNKAGLARVLNTDETMAANIMGFAASPFISEAEIIEMEILKEQLKSAQAESGNTGIIADVIQRIEIENRHSFEITIRTLNPQVMPNMQEALVGYLRNSDYVKRRIDINKTILLERKAKLAAELQKLDSLKGVIFENYKKMAVQGREGSNNVILSDRAVTNPVEIFTQDLILYNEMKNIERSLYLQPDFELVDGFTEFSEPASPGLVKLVFIAFLLGIGVAYADVTLRWINGYLSKID